MQNTINENKSGDILVIPVLAKLKSVPSKLLGDEPLESATLANGNDFASPLSRTGYQPRTITRIALSKLSLQPNNPREIYTDSMIEEMVFQFASVGQQAPINIVLQPGTDQFFIIDGGIRFKAASRLRWVEMDVIIHDLTDARDWYAFGFRANDGTPQTDLDNGLAWARLINDTIFATYTELSDKLGLHLSRSSIVRYMTFAALPDSIIDIFKLSPNKFTAAFSHQVKQLFDSNGEEVAKKFASDILAMDLSFKKTEAKRKQLADGHPGIKREHSRQHSILMGSETLGKAKVWNDGRFVFKSDMTLSPDQQDILLKAIQEAAATFKST